MWSKPSWANPVVKSLISEYFIYFYFMCMCVLPACMPVHYVSVVPWPCRPVEGTGVSATRVTDGCEPLYGCWESNQVLWESSQPLDCWAISPAISTVHTLAWFCLLNFHWDHQLNYIQQHSRTSLACISEQIQVCSNGIWTTFSSKTTGMATVPAF